MLKCTEDDIEYEFLTVISIDPLLVYKNRYYLQVYLDNCPYKIANRQLTDYLGESFIWRLDIVNSLLR